MVDSQKNIQEYKKDKNYLDLFMKIEPQALINLEHIKLGDWDFFYNTQKMLTSKELDMLMDKVKSSRLPDMFYGYNRFYITNSKRNFVLEINPIQMIDLCNYTERSTRLYLPTENNKISNASIYYIPNDIKVQFYNKWKNIKVDRDDIQKIDPISDWSFTSPYIGEISKLKSHKIYEENLDKFKDHFDLNNFDFSNLEIVNNSTSGEEIKNFEFVIETTDEEIPLNRLTRDNPIVHYMEVNLFDDELNDNGLSQGNFRFRIMNDCFFGLLRNYLRVDNVLCRIFDTRIFHSFGDNYILRDFQVKENTYDEIKSKGFVFTSDFSLSHTQSDSISKFLDVKFSFKDKIILFK